MIEVRMIEQARARDVTAYLAARGIALSPPRNGWAQAPCPFHKDGKERNPSFSVRLDCGAFRCHACGAKGGDVIALHMQLTGARFRDAVNDLAGRTE